MGGKNFVDALVFYFTQRKIRANRRSIKDNLREHPFYPSINSISDTLRQFGVPNFSIDLTNVQVPSSETFTDMPKPFFCVVKEGKESEVAVVTDVTEGAITWYHQKRLTKSNWQEFASTWTGYLIAPFPKENAGENGFWKTRIREIVTYTLIGLLIVSTLLGFFNHYLQGATFSYFSLLFLKVLGSIICISLIAKDLHSSDGIVTMICKATKSNCDEVTAAGGLSYGLSALISLQGLKELAFFSIPFITWNFLQPVLKGYYQGQKDAFFLGTAHPLSEESREIFESGKPIPVASFFSAT